MIEKLWKNLSPRSSRIVKMLWSAFTMFFIGFGIYLQIEADIPPHLDYRKEMGRIDGFIKDIVFY